MALKYQNLRKREHGSYAYFTDPNELEAAFIEYCQWCDDNPVSEAVLGKMGDIVMLPRMHPHTLIGFCDYLGLSDVWLHNFEKSVTANTTEFKELFHKMKSHCRSHNLKGAMAGQLNANIVARYLGLVDKSQVDTNNVNVGIYKLLLPDDGRTINADIDGYKAMLEAGKQSTLPGPDITEHDDLK